MPRHKSVKGMAVMKSKCHTCPFGPHGDAQTADNVLRRTIGKASQLCHHPELKGKPPTHICRGQHDIQLKILVAQGYLTEATDAAFIAKSKELGVI